MRLTSRSRGAQHRRGLTALAVLGTGVALLVGTGQAAAAHDRLQSTDPADGSVVEVAPASVVLTFDQPALALGSRVVVIASDGSTVSAGAPRLVDDDVTQDLAGDLPAGEYHVEWRVTSADGHPVSGEFSFSASAPGQGAVAAPTDAPAGSTAAGSTAAGSTATLLLGAAGVLLVLGATAVTVALRRRRS